MKRFFFAFFLVVLLTSCGNVAVKQPQFPIPISGRVTANYQQTSFTADLQALPDGGICLTLIQPELLSGMKIICNSGGSVVERDSISLPYSDGELEKICPFAQIYDILVRLNAQKPAFETSGEKLKAVLNCLNSECTVIVNGNSGLLEEIKTEKCVFVFENEEVS